MRAVAGTFVYTTDYGDKINQAPSSVTVRCLQNTGCCNLERKSERDRDRETDRQGQRQRDRGRETGTERLTDKQRQKETEE